MNDAQQLRIDSHGRFAIQNENNIKTSITIIFKLFVVSNAIHVHRQMQRDE